MADPMLVAGETTICMAKVSIFGLMEDAMKVSMTWTKNKDLVHTNGQMEEYMKEIGMLESNMAWVNTNYQMEP